MHVVYAKQPFPDSWTSAIFLAGPTPRDEDTPSWRPEALQLLDEMGYDGVVFVPEVEDGEWKSGADAYLEQVEWERRGLDAADQVVFWVPREMRSMPALTTNVELGLYASSEKCVLGAPPDATSIKYLRETLRRDVRDREFSSTLEATLRRAVERTGGGALRRGGERYVPLHVWNTPSFQAWYRAQVGAGNRLDFAKVLWQFRPEHGHVFSWVLQVSVWVEAEQRHKSNEWVFARTDISTVCLYRWPSAPWNGLSEIADVEVVLVREFRSPARTADGYVRELPGGSSVQPGRDPLAVASDEVHEETGLILPASRFQPVMARQVAATLSAHHAYLYACELTEQEMAQARAVAQAEAVYGNEGETERTYVEVTTLRDLLACASVDWATVGMIAQVVLRG
jgi:hypothetical protein